MVPKAKGEILGVVIVESGWGSMLPTIVLANLLPGGPAARCGQLNIGDQVRITYTVWKFHDFSITQILREINVADSSSAKSASLEVFRGFEF